jgi:hypothetical protein
VSKIETGLCDNDLCERSRIANGVIGNIVQCPKAQSYIILFSDFAQNRGTKCRVSPLFNYQPIVGKNKEGLKTIPVPGHDAG